jgi:hypothetical protein
MRFGLPIAGSRGLHRIIDDPEFSDAGERERGVIDRVKMGCPEPGDEELYRMIIRGRPLPPVPSRTVVDGLSASAANVFTMLKRGPQRVSALAMPVDWSMSVSDVVDELEERGLIERSMLRGEEWIALTAAASYLGLAA